jgi:hypothetical protein
MGMLDHLLAYEEFLDPQKQRDALAMQAPPNEEMRRKWFLQQLIEQMQLRQGRYPHQPDASWVLPPQQRWREPAPFMFNDILEEQKSHQFDPVPKNNPFWGPEPNFDPNLNYFLRNQMMKRLKPKGT